MEPASKRLRVLAQQTQPVEVSNPVVVFSGTRCRGSARLWSRYVSSPSTRVWATAARQIKAPPAAKAWNLCDWASLVPFRRRAVPPCNTWC
jgi:hypothetical protein